MADFDFHEQNGELRLSYEPDEDRGGPYWLYKKLREGGLANIRRVFHFERRHLTSRMPKEEELLAEDRPLPPSPTFRVGESRGDYFAIDKEVLGLSVDLLIHKDVTLTIKTFVAEGNISIFGRIAELKPQRIVIGGDEQDSIPIVEFEKLLKNFPTSTELRKYAAARVSAVVGEYFEAEVNAQADLEKYVARRVIQKVNDISSKYAKFDAEKFRELHTRLSVMLNSVETYLERTWQKEIIQIICLLYPRYICALMEVSIPDSYHGGKRRVDYMLFDTAGHVDIVEIKKPDSKSIISATQHRFNFIPQRELAGTIMQVEKYIYRLNKLGKTGEEELSKKYRNRFPEGFKINIINPGGMIIMGRDNGLNSEQRSDFEVIRRKYKNVIDIITYDDLLRRLDFVVKQFRAEEF